MALTTKQPAQFQRETFLYRDIIEDLDFLSDIQSQDKIELFDDCKFSDLSDIEHVNYLLVPMRSIQY